MRLTHFKNPALRLDLLEPGDVVLSSAPSVLSTVNKSLQWEGKRPLYSHAALVIEPCEWMESMGDGVLVTYVKLDKIEDRPGGYHALHFIDRAHYRTIAIFRHPVLKATIGTGRWRHVAETLRNQSQLLYGHEYSNLSRLAGASSVLRRIALYRTVMSAAKTAEKLKILKPKLIPGAFCSELVAILFLTLSENVDSEIHLLKNHLEELEIGPSILSDPKKSNLVEVHNAITEVGQDADVLSPRRWRHGPFFQNIHRQKRDRDVFIVQSGVALERMNATLKQLDKQFGWVYEVLKLAPQESEVLDNARWDTKRIDAEQRVINSLFADLDSKAKLGVWDDSTLQSEIIGRNDVLIDFQMKQLMADEDEAANSVS
jgi:hypothetical protein